jgi:hypothetical protein
MRRGKTASLSMNRVDAPDDARAFRLVIPCHVVLVLLVALQFVSNEGNAEHQNRRDEKEQESGDSISRHELAQRAEHSLSDTSAR